MKTLIAFPNGTARAVPDRSRGVRGWQRWAPFAAVAWSLIYAALGVYWAVTGRGFPYTSETAPDVMAPLLGRFGAGVAWSAVLLAGIPAAAVGAAMRRGVRSRALRLLFIAGGAGLAGVLLLLMVSLDLLVKVGYVPLAVLSLFTGAEMGRVTLESWTQWATIHQLLCLLGGFLWLAATVSYARRSGGACLYCGRGDGPEGWTSPDRAARWGRIAVYLAMVAPLFYGLTRYAWALGIPLGMSDAYLRRGQESGMWTSGLLLATFALVGAVVMLGLVQRWGEVFPRWMIGLAGRRVPIALAVVPASIASVLFLVGGVGIWTGLDQMVANLAAGGSEGIGLAGEIIFQVGPTLLFPFWGVALAVATLGYYYRRRGRCGLCGRGASGESIPETGQSMSECASPSKSGATTKVDIMTTITAFVKRHPVLTYFALTFAISWGGALLVIGGPRGIPGTGKEIERLMPLVMLAWFAGPSLAGILLTGLIDGRAGLRQLVSRLLRWRVGARWYAVALLTAPLLMTALLLALSLISPDFRPRLIASDDRASLLAFGFAAALMTAFFEELGQTGFAVPRLRLRYGVLATGLIVGLLWGAWRSLVVVWAGSGAIGSLAPILFYPLGLFSWLPAFRVLMVWVYDRTGSLLVAILMHTSLIASWTILTPLTITGGTLVTYYLLLTAAICLVTGALAVLNHPQLSPGPPRTRMA